MTGEQWRRLGASIGWPLGFAAVYLVGVVIARALGAPPSLYWGLGGFIFPAIMVPFLVFVMLKAYVDWVRNGPRERGRDYR